MTFYALSSGPGLSGVAVIRVSGSETVNVIKHLTNSSFYGCVESNGYSRIEILSNDPQNPILTLDLQGMVSAF